jgi:hypothetical protein
MARRDDLGLFAEKHGIKWGTIEDLISYRVENEKTIERIDERPFNTSFKISTITDAGSKPARRAKSQPASVCPGRINTPPGCAISGKICPGCTMSVDLAFGAC